MHTECQDDKRHPVGLIVLAVISFAVAFAILVMM